MTKAAHGFDLAARFAGSPLFDFTAKLHDHPRQVRAALGHEPGRSLATVFLDLASDACNHDCVFCDGSLYAYSPAQFTTPRLLDLADEMVDLGADSVILVGEKSEPTLHPGFVKVSEKLLRLGLHLGVYTNGSRVKGDILRVLEGFDFVRVSLNCATEATHRALHRYGRDRNDFDRARCLLRTVAASGVPSVGASFLLVPDNVREIRAAADLVMSLGGSYLEVKPAYGPGYSFDSPGFLEMVPELLVQLDRCLPLLGDGFRVILNSQLLDYFLGEVAADHMTTRAGARPCLTRRLRLVVNPRGCYGCPPLRGHEDANLGDAGTATLESIWYGSKHCVLMHRPCSLRCTYHKQNEILLALRDGRSLKEADSPDVQKGFL